MSGSIEPPPLRILIADDDAMIRMIARAVVERAGMIASEATNGAEALAQLPGVPAFDLVLLDLEMPVISGLEVLRAIRSRADTARVPVLVLTGADESDFAVAMQLGATGVFPKPIATGKLLERIRETAR